MSISKCGNSQIPMGHFYSFSDDFRDDGIFVDASKRGKKLKA